MVITFTSLHTTYTNPYNDVCTTFLQIVYSPSCCQQLCFWGSLLPFCFSPFRGGPLSLGPLSFGSLLSNSLSFIGSSNIERGAWPSDLTTPRCSLTASCASFAAEGILIKLRVLIILIVSIGSVVTTVRDPPDLAPPGHGAYVFIHWHTVRTCKDSFWHVDIV